MVNGTQVVGCGEMSETRVRVEQFAGANVFRKLPGFTKPHTECCYSYSQQHHHGKEVYGFEALS
jgi:hypothetical protein